jgi:molybdopterin-binding protein
MVPVIEAKRLFHVSRIDEKHMDYPYIRRDFPEGFSVDSIFAVTNDLLSSQYAARRSATTFLRGPDHLNEKIAFHVTEGNLYDILQIGLDPRLSKKGFFGRGIYTALKPMKANDYSTMGNPYTTRVMLRCKVLQGASKEFEYGRFDRDLVVEPKDCDSVLGFIRHDTEIVFYTSDRVLITHVIFYKFKDTELELKQPPMPEVPGIVGITVGLSGFFSQIEKRVAAISQASVKQEVKRLLKREITASVFIEAVEALSIKMGPDMAALIEAELLKCKLEPTRLKRPREE